MFNCRDDYGALHLNTATFGQRPNRPRNFKSFDVECRTHREGPLFWQASRAKMTASRTHAVRTSKRILERQPNFKERKSLVQEVIEAVGHLCIFLPKFHWELNSSRARSNNGCVKIVIAPFRACRKISRRLWNLSQFGNWNTECTVVWMPTATDSQIVMLNLRSGNSAHQCSKQFKRRHNTTP